MLTTATLLDAAFVYANIQIERRQQQRDLAAGRRPACSGSGSDYIHANGWIGCDECAQLGTADAWEAHQTPAHP